MNTVRTRFAPSPTGFMHIGNLRTALYSYLWAKHNNGRFILRIEDTDQKRFVEGAVEAIYKTLSLSGITHDEGPDTGGEYGPYVQSERKEIYLKYAHQLVESGHAYYCFCQKENTPSSHRETDHTGYNRACRNLTAQEVQAKLDASLPYVIRQKVPLSGETSYTDAVYGTVTVQNSELDDMILIKSDGMATYNFANVIDDHLMHITHVLRGADFLSSTPKYVLLYEAFGWTPPVFVHLPLIMGRNSDGTTGKLSKRHGATSFEELCQMGYEPQAIINYIALLGWSSEDNREIMDLRTLEKAFCLERINKSSAVFDYAKLSWINQEYLKALPPETFIQKARPFAGELPQNLEEHFPALCRLLQGRIDYFAQIPQKISFLIKQPPCPAELYENKKAKTTPALAKEILPLVLGALEELEDFSNDTLFETLSALCSARQIKKNALFWIVRIAVSSTPSTPGGATELMEVLGKEESLRRLQLALNAL